MAKIESIDIRCQHCREWFPSPIFFSDSDSFDMSTLLDNQAQCRNCQRMTGCDKKNLRVRFEGGGFLGVDT